MAILIESSRRDLSITMIVQTLISKNNLITPVLRFTLIPKTDTGLPKTGIIFYCVLFLAAGNISDVLW